MRRTAYVIALIFLSACRARDPAVLFNAPPELDGARVFVDDQAVGYLKTTHSYRRGRFAARNEFGGPPRYEANLALDRLALGTHRVRIVKVGYREYRGTFRNRSAHVEIFIPDEAAQQSGR